MAKTHRTFAVTKNSSPSFGCDHKAIFHSITYGNVDLRQLLACLERYISQAPESRYRIIIGTDSQLHNQKRVDFVIAVIVHRVGAGGIYFWQKMIKERLYSLRERIFTEATISLSFAAKFIEDLRGLKQLGYELEIHVDIGQKGETREWINEVVGMIRGSGFEVKTKPDAFGASKVADRHV